MLWGGVGGRNVAFSSRLEFQVWASLWEEYLKEQLAFLAMSPVWEMPDIHKQVGLFWAERPSRCWLKSHHVPSYHSVRCSLGKSTETPLEGYRTIHSLTFPHQGLPPSSFLHCRPVKSDIYKTKQSKQSSD